MSKPINAVVVEAPVETKTFEIIFANEPTLNQLFILYARSCNWVYNKVLKRGPTNFRKTKSENGYWIVNFEVHPDDWLFWCGVCIDRDLGVVLGKEGDLNDWYFKHNNIRTGNAFYYV